MLFHELGHALVDQWDLPVLGREEDAVDAFSTIFMTEFVEQRRVRARRRGLLLLPRRHADKLGEVDFADEHSFDKQRAYSIACWVYGSNPTRYGFLRTVLPGRAPRAVRRRVPEAEEGLAQLPPAAPQGVSAR